MIALFQVGPQATNKFDNAKKFIFNCKLIHVQNEWASNLSCVAFKFVLLQTLVRNLAK